MKPKSSLLNLFKSFPFSFVMSVPPTKIWPAVTLSIVDMQFSNVVFPEPLSPTTEFLLVFSCTINAS